MKNKTTIKDVARKAGVSTALVSFVFNKRANIRPETAERVRKCADILGYKYNGEEKKRGPKAGSRRRRPLKKLRKVHLLSAHQCNPWQVPVYSELLNSVENALSAINCDLIVRNINDFTELNEIVNGKTDGIITLSGNKDLIKKLHDDCSIPVIIAMGIPDESSLFDHISFDNILIGKLAAEYLLKKGHRKFAVFLDNNRLARGRSSAFCEKISEAGFTAKEYFRPSDQSENEKFIKNLKAEEIPPAVFCEGPYVGIWFYQILYMKGLVPLKDVEIISCGREKPELHPKPPVIDIHTDTIGLHAVRQLQWRINNQDKTRVKLLITPEILEADYY